MSMRIKPFHEAGRSMKDLKQAHPQVTLSEALSSELKELCDLVQQTFGVNPKAEETFARWIAEPQYHVSLARLGPRLIGVSAGYFIASPDLTKYELFGPKALDFLRDQKLGWFLTLAVLPDFRRQNIGWMLANEQSLWVKAQGCTAMVGSSWVTGSDDNSGHMFLKAGFHKLGESHEFLRSQLRQTGAVCSGCHQSECTCKSVLFGLKLDLKEPQIDLHEELT